MEQIPRLRTIHGTSVSEIAALALLFVSPGPARTEAPGGVDPVI